MNKLFSSILLILALCLAAPAANAQFRWSGTAGVSVNSLKFKQDLVDVSSTIGYSAGVNGELMFPGIGFGMSIGMLYNQQGGKANLGQREVWAADGYGNEQIFLHNILIPVHLRFKYTRLNGLEDKIAPLVFGGPEFDIQVAHGKCKAFDYSGGDLGLTAGIGAEIFKRWQITGSYTWGMTYVLKTSLLDNFSARSRQWNVRLAYFF
jgi:hypothetical protein